MTRFSKTSIVGPSLFGIMKGGSSPSSRSLGRACVKMLLCSVWVTLVTLLQPSDAVGAIEIQDPFTHVQSLTIPPDGDVVTLNPFPLTYVPTASPALQLALFGQFPFANVTVGQPLNGTLTILIYDALEFGPHTGGAGMLATYFPASTDPPLGNLQYIQLVDTNFPQGGQPNPRIDTFSVTNPFYPFAFKNPINNSFTFVDFPSRPCRDHPDEITWRAELYLVSQTGPFDITIHDGIRWGFDLVCVPEIDPGSMAGALTLLSGGVLTLTDRRRRKS